MKYVHIINSISLGLPSTRAASNRAYCATGYEHNDSTKPVHIQEDTISNDRVTDNQEINTNPGSDEYRGEQLSMPMEEFISPEARKKHRLIGQVFKTYWLIEFENKLYIMDQHAAHEKVMFEHLMKMATEKKILSQQLMPPKVVHIDNAEHNLLNAHIEFFEQTGFEIEDFGDDAIVLRAVPDDIMGIDPQLLFDELINVLKD